MASKVKNILLSKMLQSISIYVMLVILVGFAIYIRLLPAINYGLKYLNEADPWERYWLSVYFFNHNLLGFSGLEHVNTW